MDIFENLKNVVSEGEIQQIRESFESAVSTKVKEKLDEQITLLKEQYDKQFKDEVNKEIAIQKAELDELSNKYVAEKTEQIKSAVSKMLIEHMQKLENLSEDYVEKNFEEKYAERFAEDLARMESSFINLLNEYLDYTIGQKISPKLIETVAINETYAATVEAMKEAFELNYAPLNTNGSVKLRECKQEIANLQNSLKKQFNENVKLNKLLEKTAKRSLIAEKTSGLSESEKAKVHKFFEGKSLSDMEHDIDNYVQMVTEQTQLRKFSKPSRENSYKSSAVSETKRADYIKENFKRETKNDEELDILSQSSFID